MDKKTDSRDIVQLKIPKGQIIVVDGIKSQLVESIYFKAKLMDAEDD
jgi:hypothetical protein